MSTALDGSSGTGAAPTSLPSGPPMTSMPGASGPIWVRPSLRGPTRG